MTLKNEIFEGIAAYKALAGDSRDRYYDYLLGKARKEDEIMRKSERVRDQARTGGQYPGQPQSPHTTASTGTPGGGFFERIFGGGGGDGTPPFNPDAPRFFAERGGPVQAFEAGGLTRRGYGSRVAAPGAGLGSVIMRGPSQEPSMPQDDLLMSLLASDNEQRIADESVPNTRARRDTGLRPPGEMDTASTPGVSAAIDTGPPSAGPLPDAPPIPASMRPPPQMGLTRQSEVDSATGMQPARQLVDAEIKADRPTPRPQRATPRIAAPDAELPGITSEELAGAGEQPPEGAPRALSTGAPGRAPIPDMEGPDYANPTSSKIGRALGPTMSPQAEQLNSINARINQLVKQKQEVDAGLFQQQTSEQQADTERQVADLDMQIQELIKLRQQVGGGSAEPSAPATAAAPGSPAAGGQGSQAPGTAAPAQPASPGVNMAPPTALKTFDPWAAETNPPKQTNQVAPPGSPRTNGQPSSGTNTPGGNPSSASPPRISRLDDQRRDKAFNPDDPNDAAQAQARGTTWQSGQATDMSMQPQPYTNEQVAQVLKAGVQAMPQSPNGGPPVIGQGANSRPAFNQFVGAYSNNGTLTPGMAMVRGLVAQYQYLVGQGRPDLAAKIASSVLQSANLEAASYGHQALDAARSGDGRAAVGAVVKGLDMIPDNMSHAIGPDGKSIVVSNQQGQPTGRIPLSGPLVLKIAMGLSDGTLMWQALQQGAMYGQKPDTGAEGRALTNQLRREQIEGARLRNDKMRRGPVGKPGVASTQAGAAAADIVAKYGPQGTNQPPPQQRSQGDDTGNVGGTPIDLDIRDTE